MAQVQVSEILAALEQAAEAHEIDIVDVEVVGATKAPCVRVRIDHADETLPVIGLDEVTANTRWISDILDELDPFAGSYQLEVSSPGMSRPLRRAHDFERFAGETVALNKKPGEGRRKFTGTLEGFEDGEVLLTVDGDQVRVPLEDVQRCTIKPSFD